MSNVCGRDETGFDHLDQVGNTLSCISGHRHSESLYWMQAKRIIMLQDFQSDSNDSFGSTQTRALGVSCHNSCGAFETVKVTCLMIRYLGLLAMCVETNPIICLKPTIAFRFLSSVVGSHYSSY